MKVGDRVSIKCPVYKNGNKHYGVVINIDALQARVKIDGNKKTTLLARIWLMPIKATL